jgi:hypothetical protein
MFGAGFACVAGATMFTEQPRHAFRWKHAFCIGSHAESTSVAALVTECNSAISEPFLMLHIATRNSLVLKMASPLSVEIPNFR